MMISRYVAGLCLLHFCLVQSGTLRANSRDKNTDYGVLSIEQSLMNIFPEFKKTESNVSRRIYFRDYDNHRHRRGREREDSIIRFSHGQWMEYKNIDFGEEGDIKSIKFRYSKNTRGGGLKALIDGTKLIGYIRPPKTGAWSAYRETSFAISGVSGVHTLRLGALDLKNDIMNLDWFELSPYDVNRPDFETLPCNVEVSLEASCYGESALSLSQLSSEAQGSEVFIECGKCAVADVVDGSEIDVKGIRVQGMLYFPPESNVTIRSKYIFVEGTLKIDPPDDIAGNKVKFYLHTNEDQYLIPHEHNQASCEYPYGDPTLGCNMGNKVLAVAGGKLDIQALPEDSKDCPAWVKLESVDYEDPRILSVGINATQCWGQRSGDEVMITNTNSIGGWNKQFVSMIESVDIERGTITLQEAPDDPATLMSDGDLAAEVVWLSRSVVFEAEQIEVWRSDIGSSCGRKKVEGGHIIIFHTPNVAQMLEGIELRGYGQESRMGRYPIHFHKCRDAPGSIVRKNVIRDSNQRCVVIHSSNEILIDNNVAFGSRGHCFILEDGDEVNNIFKNNLGAKTNTIKCSTHMNVLLASDSTTSTFWITNPRNSFVGNVAAGSINNGFWIEPISDDLNERKFNITEFQDNIAHSNVNEGFKFYQGQYRPTIESNYYNLKAYRNQGQGLRLHVNKNLRFEGLLLADNNAGMTSFDETGQIILENVTIIGLSQRGRNKYPCENRQMSGIKFAVDPVRVQLDFRNLTISGFGDVLSGCDSLALRPWPMRPGAHNADGTILVGNDKRFHSMPFFSGLSIDTYENSFDIEKSYIEDMEEKNMIHFYFEDPNGLLQPNSKIGAFIADIQESTKLLQNVCSPASARNNMAALFCPASACIRMMKITTDPGHTLVIKSNETETYHTSRPIDGTRSAYNSWVPAGNYRLEFRNDDGETITPEYFFLDFVSKPSICSNFVTDASFENYLNFALCGKNDGRCYVNEYINMHSIRFCDDGTKICYFDDGEWIEYAVNFGEEGDTKSIIVYYSKNGNNGSLEASVDGETIGILEPMHTGGWGTFKTKGFSVTGLTGLKTLRLKGAGKSGIMDIKWFELSAEDPLELALCGKNDGRCYVNEYVNMHSIRFCDDGTKICYFDGGEWIEYAVNFGEEGDTKSIIVYYSKGTNGGSLEASVDGETIGILEPMHTGGWGTFKTKGFSVTGLTGLKTLRLKGAGRSSIMDIKWFELSAENPKQHYAICGKSAGNNNAYCNYKKEGLYDDLEYKAVRCCAADPLTGFSLKCTDLVPTVYGGSKVDGTCYKEKTWDEAKDLCEGIGARLCTKDELESDCTMGTGCNFDHTTIWSSTNDKVAEWLLW